MAMWTYSSSSNNKLPYRASWNEESCPILIVTPFFRKSPPKEVGPVITASLQHTMALWLKVNAREGPSSLAGTAGVLAPNLGDIYKLRDVRRGLEIFLNVDVAGLLKPWVASSCMKSICARQKDKVSTFLRSIRLDNGYNVLCNLSPTPRVGATVLNRSFLACWGLTRKLTI